MPCWTVPFQKNLRFVGRASLLAKLDKALFATDWPSKISLFGLGGVGKTQVAVELAYRTRAKHSQCSVIWIPTNNIERLQQAYIDAAEQLGIVVPDDKTDVKRLVQRHLSHDSAGRWLVIYDNADDLDMWIPSTESQDGLPRLLEYVPQSKLGCVVFTTRSRKVAFRLSPEGLREEVPQMDDNTALQLLSGRLSQEVSEQNEEGRTLIEKLCHLPLAIVQAAAYIGANQSTLGEYLELLNEQEEDVVKLLSEKFGDEGGYHTIKDPVATTWLISLKQMQKSDPVAAEYLSLMSCFDPKDIPQSLLPPSESRKEEVDAIGTLMAYAFVSRQPATKFLDMHRLVHLATRNWLKQEENTFNLWMHRAVARLEAVFLEGDHESENVWRLYLPHARYLLQFCLSGEAGERGTRLAWQFGLCAHIDGWYGEAESCLSYVTETRKRALGVEHPSTLDSMHYLASTYREQSRWEEAERLGLQVMEARKRVLGAENRDTLVSEYSLSITYRDQGRWEEAEILQVQSMKTRKKVLGVEDPSTLASMANLALTYKHQSRLKEAEALEVQVMEAHITRLGADHPKTLASIANLASTYRELGRWKEAEALQLQAMEAHKKKLGADHPDTLACMDNLAVTFLRQGRWEDAERLELQAMEMSKTKLGASHPGTLTCMNNLAHMLRCLGHQHQASELMGRCISLRRRVLGSQHPYTRASIEALESWQQDSDQHHK